MTPEILNVKPEITQVKRKKNTSNTSDVSMYIELVNEIFTNMFKEQEEELLNIARNGISDTNAFGLVNTRNK